MGRDGMETLGSNATEEKRIRTINTTVQCDIRAICLSPVLFPTNLPPPTSTHLYQHVVLRATLPLETNKTVQRVHKDTKSVRILSNRNYGAVDEGVRSSSEEKVERAPCGT